MGKRIIALLAGWLLPLSAMPQVADIFYYEIEPGKAVEAYELLNEAAKIADETDMTLALHFQRYGPGGDGVVIWAEFYEDAFHREKVRYKGEAWEQYFNDKWYPQTALRPIDSYSMALIDEPESGVFVVDQYSFAPRPNLETEAISAMKETQKMFEDAGFKVDLWMQDEGSLGHLEFVALSTTWEERAANLKRLSEDPRIGSLRTLWFDSRELAEPVSQRTFYNIKLAN